MCESILLCSHTDDPVEMAREAVGRTIDVCRKCLTVRRCLEIFFDVGMTFTARFDKMRAGEFGIRYFRGNNIMRSVTIFTGNIRFLMRSDCLSKLRMKCMFERNVLMTRQAVKRSDRFLVRNVFRIETGMTCDAGKFFVR